MRLGCALRTRRASVSMDMDLAEVRQRHKRGSTDSKCTGLAVELVADGHRALVGYLHKKDRDGRLGSGSHAARCEGTFAEPSPHTSVRGSVRSCVSTHTHLARDTRHIHSFCDGAAASRMRAALRRAPAGVLLRRRREAVRFASGRQSKLLVPPAIQQARRPRCRAWLHTSAASANLDPSPIADMRRRQPPYCDPAHRLAFALAS